MRQFASATTLVLLLGTVACGSTSAPATSASPTSSSKPASSEAAAVKSASQAPASKPAASQAAASNPASSAPPAGLANVNAAYVSISSHTLPIWIADAKGLFKGQGLNVKVAYVQGSVTAIPAMTSGELSMVEATPAASVQAQLTGQDTVALATHVPYADYRLEAVPSIKSVEDLRGKSIAATKPGTVDDVVIQYVLKKMGFTPGKDIKMTYLDTQPAELAALANGVIQATVLSPPNNLSAEKAGAHEILNVLDLHFPYPIDGVISTRKFVREHPNETVAWLKGYVQAIRFIKSDPAETKRILSEKTKETDQHAIDVAYQGLVDDLADNPEPKTEGIQTALPLFPGGAGKNPADFVDPAPLAKAIQELGK